MTRTDPESANVDERIRVAEGVAYRAYGASGRDRYITVDGGVGHLRVRVREFGPVDDPIPVLLLHGIASANVLAAPLLPYLADRRVIALDWPGHGLSDAHVLSKTIALRAHVYAVIDSALDALDVEQVDIVGHSLGGQFSLYSALDNPARIRRVALLGAPGASLGGVTPIPTMRILAVPRVGPKLLSMPMSDRAFQRNNDLTLGAGALREAAPELVTALRSIADRTANAASIASYFRALIRWSVRSEVQLRGTDLSRIQQKVLMIWGEGDIFLTPGAAANSIVAVPDNRLVTITGAGHAPWLQALETAGTALTEHLGGPTGTAVDSD
ncbi:alpha/beta fold hydrolase [Gordonia rhizosphera]|uniref:Putative hydrolase n=1 Tax=Gordonia rhizosphera NBRC 16068 TaxID=1108045 RepID=K6VUS4_9ACTN|nr:alpha/beta hydrolase [Gordonia rhizosphera]GAB90650.1 putative hydrolase [Gordonia rhizosphera NBRC 16068]